MNITVVRMPVPMRLPAIQITAPFTQNSGYRVLVNHVSCSFRLRRRVAELATSPAKKHGKNAQEFYLAGSSSWYLTKRSRFV